MAFIDTGGSFPASIVPQGSQVAVAGNYIDFQAGAFSQWAQQYLPELYEAPAINKNRRLQAQSSGIK